ncbi:MAG: tRNA preQ1(34) S-adenosylmethionine ribosyltransferase-isomerase QueA [Candidatus Omnitrophica bacterium]|nr:tRNA preQ1(34) S-adenosylmethionine ribosyltransferase-isomerase QueA [Candidatus Omnitrophota bacterium]
MKITDFDYQLPRELIAQFPAKRRDESRLLIINRKTGRIKHSRFKEIAGMFTPADALALNDTKVKPARLIGKIKEKDIDILLVERVKKNCYYVLAKPGRKLKPKAIISFGDNKYQAEAVDSDYAIAQGMKMIEFKQDEDIEAVLGNIGVMPLPPYIKREAAAIDGARYQTIYAKIPGAIAAPTAGLHFTEATINQIKALNISIIYLTLHVGLGTFLPVKVEDIRAHKMHKEYYELSSNSAAEIEKVKRSGGRICAVGTTVTRVLETCAGEETAFTLKPGKGQTDLFIYPPYEFKSVDMLLTNFHLPKTTLLMLVCAFASTELVLEAYNKAVEEKYRFFSYGDAMLII